MCAKQIKNPPKVIINYIWCKKCGICTAFCPTGVFTEDEFNTPIISHPEKCIGCELCVMRCPEFAIDLQKETKKRKLKRSYE